MIGKRTLAAGLIAMGLLAAQSASGAPVPQSRPESAADASLVQQARHYRHSNSYRIVRLHRYRHRRVIFLGAGYGYCSAWRQNCAVRWGWHTRSYYRCVWNHGC